MILLFNKRNDFRMYNNHMKSTDKDLRLKRPILAETANYISKLEDQIAELDMRLRVLEGVNKNAAD